MEWMILLRRPSRSGDGTGYNKVGATPCNKGLLVGDGGESKRPYLINGVLKLQVTISYADVELSVYALTVYTKTVRGMVGSLPFDISQITLTEWKHVLVDHWLD